MDFNLRHLVKRAGPDGRDVALAVAMISPATGVRTWAGGECRTESVGIRTPMYAASITKQLIGVLAAQQVLAGRLDVDDPIANHLPLPRWAAPVRVRHLIHHTAGLPPPTRCCRPPGSPTSDLTNALAIRALQKTEAPAQPPGEVFSYSNVGYIVLAEVVRAVAGQALPVLARNSVFTPLGLADSHLGDAPPGTAAESTPPRTLGDGGWWTSAHDLLGWLTALNTGVLGVALTRLVQTPGHLDDGTPLSYAWGVTAKPGAAGTTYTHGGNWPGWSAKTVRQPASGTAVALLSTSNAVDSMSEAALDLHAQLARC